MFPIVIDTVFPKCVTLLFEKTKELKIYMLVRLSPGYVYGAPSYMGAMGTVGGVSAGVGAGAGGLVQLPQLQHAAAVAAANHLYEYQAAAAQGAAAYQQQYAAAGFDPYATAAGAYNVFVNDLIRKWFGTPAVKMEIY